MAISVGLFVFAFVVVLDPYDTLPFSPPLDRYPVTTNQRFSFPAIAADPAFDSLVIGTSTTRLLKPVWLDAELGGNFANLSMNSGQAWEQMRIAELFLSRHPKTRRIVIGFDTVWCGTAVEPKITDRPFPPWLYDDNPWNDVLYLFNPSAVEEAGRQLEQLAGWRKPKYGKDGYADFLPPIQEYDREKVRFNLYRDKEPFMRAAETPPEDGYASLLAGLEFPQLAWLRRLMQSIPDETEVVSLFVPYHQITQPAPGSAGEAVWNKCKQSVLEIISTRKRAHLVDFMIRSNLTMTDDNYWDPLHYTETAAQILVRKLARAIETRQSDPSYYRYRGQN